jgi:hypothetical protein
MHPTSYRSLKFSIGAAAVVAAVLTAGCSSFSSPKQIEASNPTVSYKYHNDDELVQTNDLASAFCSRYQAVPRSMSFTRDGGDDVVVYECVSTSRSSMSNSNYSNFNPNLSYTYRTDQELLNGSQNAQAYCLNNGSSRVTSNIVRNNNGTRTVTFQCR